jgi:hypothetical protein
MEVTVVNHGNVFNTKNWYTFYCPKCKKQITKQDSEGRCEFCLEDVEWPKND